MKCVIFMNGVPGTGKSYLADQLAFLFKKLDLNVQVISRDTFRMKGDEYVFDPNTEGQVKCKYFDALNDAMLNKDIDILILDNTHTDEKFIDETFDIMGETGVEYSFKFVSIIPSPTEGYDFYFNKQKHIDTNYELQTHISEWINWVNRSNLSEYKQHILFCVGQPWVDEDGVAYDLMYWINESLGTDIEPLSVFEVNHMF